MITYTATLDVSRDWPCTCPAGCWPSAAGGAPRGNRKLTCYWQAVLGLRWFRDRTAIDALGRDHRISRATAYRYVGEVTDVLPAKAQAVALPGGFPVWLSDAEPGSVHDITAARIHAFPVVVVVVVRLAAGTAAAMRIVKQYEQGVMVRLGRVQGPARPGHFRPLRHTFSLTPPRPIPAIPGIGMNHGWLLRQVAVLLCS